MITKPTVLILGAGASVFYGFPSGNTLKRDICNEGEKGAGVGKMNFNRNQVQEFIAALHHSGQPSVDAFLEHRPEFMKIGKAFIAGHLIRYESTGSLFGRDNSWYEYLLNRMASSFKDFDNNALSIITFNYDRSFEHFLFTALTSRYGKQADDVAAKLSGIPIIHVYGQLGFLEWQQKTADLPVRPYRNDVTAEEITKAALGIKILSEFQGDTDEFQEAHSLIIAAERVYFLGFGYHPENMERLKLPFPGTPEHSGQRQIRGTRHGLTDAEVHSLKVTYKDLTLTPAEHDVYAYLRNQRTFLTPD